MSDNKRLYNILGHSEVRASRILIAYAVTVFVMAVVIFALGKQNASLSAQNIALQDQRVMYGFPNADGVFVSSKVIPEAHLLGFVHYFLDNYYNFNPNSALSNINEALRLMSNNLRARQEQPLRIIATTSREQQITQTFTRNKSKDMSFEVTPQGYITKFEGDRYRSTLGKTFNHCKYEVALKLTPVRLSAHYAWGVVVDDISAREIRCESST